MKVNEIFLSIDGEVNMCGQGTMTTFIRLAGCNLRCHYCDTEYALSENQGKEMSVLDVFKKAEEIGCPKITITGGEPLMQREELFLLFSHLSAAGYTVTIETNGSYPLFFDERLGWVVDYKFQYSHKMIYTNYVNLREGDWIKFVVGSKEEFVKALKIANKMAEKSKARIAFSPASGAVDPKQLIKWMKDEKAYNIALNLQIHKYIWPAELRGV